MKFTKLFFIISFLSLSVYGADEGQENSGTAFSLFKSKTYVKNPLDLRDPFKRRINKKKTQASSRSHEAGVYTNQNDSIENKPVESIRIIGVMIGKERRAMAKVGATGKGIVSEVYYLKEGMKIGPNNAEVKAILPGGVVFVEKIRNVYDQDEYLETVVPLSSE